MFYKCVNYGDTKKPLSLDLVDWRGMFLVPKLRSLFLKLFVIDTIVAKLTLSDIGIQKKSPKNYPFVLYSVIYDILNEKYAFDLDLLF